MYDIVTSRNPGDDFTAKVGSRLLEAKKRRDSFQHPLTSPPV
jgi:hypothetical protein